MRSVFSSISVCALILVNTMALAYPVQSAHQTKEKTIPSPSYGTHFQSSSEGFFYIRVATFKDITNADKYKSYLSRTLHHSVRIRRQGGYQVLYLGPIRKANEVRALSQRILSLKNAKTRPVHIKSTTSIKRYKRHQSISTHSKIQSSSKGSLYIRAATFKVANNAYKYKNYLIEKFHQPVVIKTQGNYQVVLVGPIQSEAEMQELSNRILFPGYKDKQAESKPFESNAKHLSGAHLAKIKVIKNPYKYKNYEIPVSEQPVQVKIQANNQVVLIGPIQSEAEMKDLTDMLLTFNANRKEATSFRDKGLYRKPTSEKAYSQKQSFIEKFTAHYTPLATISIGPDFLNPGNSQTLTLFPPFQNHYTRGEASQNVADAGMFLGVERSLNKSMLMQLGLSGYVDAQISPNGEVWQFASPLFNNLSYTYHIHHSRVMATSKLLTTIPRYSAFHPYLSGEVGIAFNTANGYQETPLIDGAVPMTPFGSHNQSSFAWGFGAGIDYFLNQHVRLGMGYQFANLGSASLNPTPVALTSETLSVPHLYANQLRFQSTFLM